MNFYNYTSLRYSLVLFLLASVNILFAQSSTNVTGPIPPSAASMSFGKYADTPLNTNNGTTVVNIPLGSISDGPLSHTVSVSYLTGGIRSAELASDIGLGWTLNAGGVVGRTVRGVPDDQEDGYYFTGSTVNGGDLGDVADGEMDAEPDLFYYNVGGMTGKFIIDKNGNPFQIPQTDNKIEFSDPVDFLPIFSSSIRKAILNFTITSPDGTKYHFGAETTTSYPANHHYVQVGSGGIWHIDLWKLMKIESFDKKHSITFEYSNVNDYATPFHNDCFVLKSLNNSTDVNNCNNDQTQLLNSDNMISKISSSTGEIEFLTTTRLDLINVTNNPPKRINKIEFNNGLKCYKYDFTQSYFDTDAPSGPLAKKLKLDQIQRKDCQETIEEEPYVFEYLSGQIAGLNSKAIDHWGYFTHDFNRNNYDHNIPYSSEQGVTFGIGSRSSSPAYMDNGALKKVTYPTKGSTEYFYEANKAVISTPNSGSSPVNIFNTQTCSDNYGACCGFKTVSHLQSSITQEMINTGSLEITTDYVAPCSSYGNSIPVDFVIKDNAGAIIFQESFNLTAPNNNLTYERTLFNVGVTTPGNYRFELTSEDGQAEITVDYTPNTTAEENVGGLRIQKIETYDGLNANDKIIRTFDYDDPNTNQTSGRLNSEPKYVHFISSHNKVLFSSTTFLPLASEAGYHINYAHVKESKNGNGHIKSEMNFETYLYSQLPSYPAKPSLFLVNNGTPKETQVLNQSGGIESSTSVTRNEDQYVEAVGIIYAAKDLGDFTLPSYYSIRTNVYRPKTSTTITDGITSTTDYEYHPQNKILSPYKIKTTNSDGKEHETHFTYTVDYWDPTIQHNLKPNFIARNMIGINYQTFKFVDNEIIDGTRTEFSNFSNAGYKTASYGLHHFPRPYKTERWERTWFNGNLQSGSWEDKSYMLQYNSNGLLYRYQQDGWNETQYTYNSDKLLTKKAFNGHETEYAYYPNSSLLQETTAVDGTTSSYTYDALMRLKTKTDDCNNITTTYNYHLNSSNITSQKNYVETVTDYLTPTTDSDLDIVTNRTYIDGLGRSIQTVKVGQEAETSKDVLISTAYDNQGRSKYSYQPKKSIYADGRYVTPTTSWLKSTTEYYPSPLNRTKRTRPTDNWYWTNYEYGSNTTADNVKIDGTSNAYANGLLSKQTMIDPDGKKSISFSDKMGRAILSRHTNNAEATSEHLDTYNLYDDKNRVTYVLPPGVPNTSSTYQNLYYHYQYNGEDQVTEKKIPGANVVKFKYNDQDLLGGYQDGYLNNENKWYTYQYDIFGRGTTEGFYDGTPGTDFTPTEPLIKTFYGTSSHNKDKIARVETRKLDENVWLKSYNIYNTCGVLTNQNGNNHLNVNNDNAITTAYILDGGLNTTKTTSNISAYGVTKNIVNTQTYGNEGRPRFNYFSIDGAPNTTLSNKAYTTREELKYVYQGYSNNQYLQKIDFTYELHGPLKRINSSSIQGSEQAWNVCTDPPMSNPGNDAQKDLFSLELFYDTNVPGIATTIQKNGNIAGVRWQVKGRSQGNYTFTYDTHNRLTEAKYADRDDGVISNNDRYGTQYSYDQRGNLTQISRKGMYDTNGCTNYGTTDALLLNYPSNSNQLTDVADFAPSASDQEGYDDPGNNTNQYDANGNMTSYPDKGITIQYNHLNLPKVVSISGTPNSIVFTYDAAGNLLRRQNFYYFTGGKKIDYVAGIEYLDGQVHQIMHSEGFVQYTNGANPQYHYTINDHLGNTRLVYSDFNGDGKIRNATEIVQENHYYPFGMKMKGPWMGDENEYRYKYNGIEEVDDFGLDLSFATFRTLDPSIGRWLQVDPKGEAMYGINPYNAMANNPISFNDPDGDIIPAMLVGAAIGLVTNGISNVSQGNNFFQGGLKAAGIGALSGAVSFGIGNAASSLSGIGKAAFQMGAHGFSGGVMSGIQGGSFASGFLSGALSSGMSSGASALGVGNAGMIGIGGLSGGIGSSIAGGSFWRGAGQGLITSGLNHAAHGGLLGDNIAASLISGRARHMFGPDAISKSATLSTGIAATAGLERGELEILRGPDKGTHPISDASLGAGYSGLSVGGEFTKLYYSGRYVSQIHAGVFYGTRTEIVLSAGVGVNASVNAVYSGNSDGMGGFTFGWGAGLGVGAVPGFGAEINWGASHRDLRSVKGKVNKTIRP